jgi:hypothetical protein
VGLFVALSFVGRSDAPSLMSEWTEKVGSNARLSGETNSLVVLRVLQPQHVMPGLVPGIHAQKPSPTSKVVCGGAAWMAGTSPAMTTVGCTVIKFSRFSCRLEFPRTGLHKGGGNSSIQLVARIRISQRRQGSQSSAISGLSKLRGFPQPDSHGSNAGMAITAPP